MIQFIECQEPGYGARTRANAKADATIAIALDFGTPGEILTKKMAGIQEKLYIPIHFDEVGIEWIANRLMSAGVKEINIAGNGVYTTYSLRKYEQKHVDIVTYNMLATIIENMLPSLKPTLIRSGGQSGVDEAGLKAAIKLGIPALCLAPRGWYFRDINGKDIADEELFKARFNQSI